MAPPRWRWEIVIMLLTSLLLCFPNFLSLSLAQILPAGGIYGQISLPEYQYRPRPLPYANTLWPFSGYSDGYGSPSVYSPAYYSPWQQPQQQQPQQLQLNDLIAELSAVLVRSFAQMLAEQEVRGANGARPGGGIAGLFRPSGGGARDGTFGGIVPFGLPNLASESQVPLLPGGGRFTTNYGYGVNAGVFAGTYGGSDSVVGPMGPYGSLNSQVGTPYSGHSWPVVPGRPQPPSGVPQPRIPAQPRQNASSPQGGQPAVVGEGTVVQIPLSENVQGQQAEGSGGGELPAAEGEGGGT